MINKEKVRRFRKFIEQMASEVSDEVALEHPEAFPKWSGDGVAYTVGERVRFDDILYKVLQDHTSQDSWAPNVAPSLFVRVDDPTIEWPDWVQPVGATDAYPAGAKVSHNEKHWISSVDNNVWEPGVYGWEEVE